MTTIQICKCRGLKKDDAGWTECSTIFVRPFEPSCPNGCAEDWIELRYFDNDEIDYPEGGGYGRR